MQQIIFTRMSDVFYRLQKEAVYAYLPEGRNEEADAQSIWKQGGIFIYLRHSAADEEAVEKGLLLFLERLQGSFYEGPGILFLDNNGPMLRHWGMSAWHFQEGRMERTGVFWAYGYEAVLDENAVVSAVPEGLILGALRFGKGEQTECIDAVFSWEGELRFKTPDFQASLFWNEDKESAFIYQEGALLRIADFPPARMQSLRYCFVKGQGRWTLVPLGTGYFTEGGIGRMGRKGAFWLEKGDWFQLSREMAEPLMELRAPFYGGGIELSIPCPVPLLPEGEEERREAERRLYEKVRDEGAFVYGPGIRLGRGSFETCMYKEELLWFCLSGTKSAPGLALCRPDKALALTFSSDSFFVLLDAGTEKQFSTPYTIDRERIRTAVKEGYPAEEGAHLERLFPGRQTFLNTASFEAALAAAGCASTDGIRQVCQHFRLLAGQREFRFPPDTWRTAGVLLVVKKGSAFSVSELAADMGLWDFAPKDTERAKLLLKEACESVKATKWEVLFGKADWEGSLVFGQEWKGFLILTAGETEPVFVPKGE